MNTKGFGAGTTKKMRAACKMTKTSDAGDWTDLRTHAIYYVDEYVRSRRELKSINLAELVQFVTLKLSLFYLFDDAERALQSRDTFQDIVYISGQINRLWVDSKKSDGARPQWKDQVDLHKALRNVTTVCKPTMPGSFPGDQDSETGPPDPDENPMNLLLPAYETMWRVVLRCYMEIRLRDATNSPEWHRVVTNYLEELKDPQCMDRKVFQEASPSGVRPIDIAEEALRLHPPSRHVHRDFNGELVRADIEACHRSNLLGGDDPLVFRPERWQDICPEQRENRYGTESNTAAKLKGDTLKKDETALGFIPFATYCTADEKETRRFAMKMIILLVAVICGGLGAEWPLAGAQPGPQQPLDSDREAYTNVLLRKV